MRKFDGLRPGTDVHGKRRKQPSRRVGMCKNAYTDEATFVYIKITKNQRSIKLQKITNQLVFLYKTSVEIYFYMKKHLVNVLRLIVGVQLACLFFGPPIALAVVFDNSSWLTSIVPWGLFCAFLYGVARGAGWIEFKDSLLGKVYVTAPDSVHFMLLKINSCVLAVILFFAVFYGHI